MDSSIRLAFGDELTQARRAYHSGDDELAFRHLERAHIMGQRSFTMHLVSHVWMLRVGIHRRDSREIFGQLLRMVAVVPGYVFGWIPKGNTGGADVSPLKPMVIPPDLERIVGDLDVMADVRMRLKILGAVLLFLILGGGGALLLADQNRAREAAALDYAWSSRKIAPVSDFGSTNELEIVSLVNWHSDDPQLRTEPGVSYLVRTDEHTILFDVGFNRASESPSPLEHNMKTLGISLDEVDVVFISHLHRDHVGGLEREEQSTFSLGMAPANLSNKRLFAPVPMQYPGSVVQTVEQPRALVSGVASTGPIPRRLFMGRIDEQALVIHLAGRGLVLLVGCGHQTVPRLIERVEESFDEPVYAVVGDLHYPVPEGRLKIAGIDAQRRFASGDGVFAPISADQIDREIELLRRRLSFVALGGHDTHERVFESFARAFGKQFRRVSVGQSVVFEAVAQ